MKLQDFLSIKAKCIKELDPRYFNSWDVGETYDISITIQVTDKNNDDICFEPQDFLDHFEPVLDESKSQDDTDTSADSVDNYQASLVDNADNSQASLVDNADNSQDPHLSSPSNNDATHVSEPYNDALFPRFEVGQKAYCPWLNDGGLVRLGLDDNGDLIAQTKKGLQAFDCEGYALDCTPRQPDLFPATDYYFEHLSAIMPWIEFEAPPVELKGSDLAKALIKKGWCGFNCVCGNNGDDDVMITTIVTDINGSGQFIDIDGRLFNNAKPMLGSYPLTAEQVGL